MFRPRKVPTNIPAVARGRAKGATAAQQLQTTGRAPQNYKESMLYIPTKASGTSKSILVNKARVAQSAQKTTAQPTAAKWKSSFKPTGELSQDVGSQDKSEGISEGSQDISEGMSERTELYDPYDGVSSGSESEMLHGRYDPVSSEAEAEMLHGRYDSVSLEAESEMLQGRYDPVSSEAEAKMLQGPEDGYCRPDQDPDLGHCSYESWCPDGSRRDNRRWESSYSEPGNRPLGAWDFSPETGPTECPGPSKRPTEQQAYSPNTEPLERPGYSSFNRPLDHRGFSPDERGLGSSAQLTPSSGLSTLFPASYGGQVANGEEKMTIPEYRREMPTIVRLSPPRLHRDYLQKAGYVRTGEDQITPSSEVTRNNTRSRIREMEHPITCELCDVQFAKTQDLAGHLESKCHWDTLEHIQQQNNYDDLAIAFLQEIMQFKVRQCSRGLEESEIEALQERDHMTKVEMFHCAACQVHVSIAATSVKNHLSSQEHLHNKKEFEMRQREMCLDKADIMLLEMKPQFEQFLEGGDPLG